MQLDHEYFDNLYDGGGIEPSLDSRPTRDWGMMAFLTAAAIGIICLLALVGGRLLSAQVPQPVVVAPTSVQAQYRYHEGAALNDLDVTPGAINGLTKDQLCDPHFHTGTVRAVSEATKQKVCRQYGIARADCTGQRYEIDHLISLELGGSNDITNLWPQPYAPKPGAKEKDVVENHLHTEVCAGRMTLPQAQLAISTDWYQVFLDINAPLAKTGAGR